MPAMEPPEPPINELMLPLIAPSPDLKREKRKQIAAMTRQCFDILDTYGKSPDALENLVLAMATDLENFSLPEIQAAFTEWRKVNTKIPTPAGILKLIHEARRAEAQAQAYIAPPNPNDWAQKTPQERAEFNRFMDNLLCRNSEETE